jgi:hypothetical protein
VWLRGRFGSGKTAFAYRIAQYYLDQGYKLISNNANVWDEGLNVKFDLETKQLKLVVILDEGGLYFKASKQIEMMAAYAAKMDIIIIIPSFFPPARNAQVLVIQPLFNFSPIGLPITLYRWVVNLGGFKDAGTFFWSFPAEVYGIYSRNDPGDRGQDIINYLIERTNEFRQLYGRSTDEISGMAQATEGENILDAAGIFQDAVDGFASLPKRKR